MAELLEQLKKDIQASILNSLQSMSKEEIKKLSWFQEPPKLTASMEWERPSKAQA